MLLVIYLVFQITFQCTTSSLAKNTSSQNEDHFPEVEKAVLNSDLKTIEKLLNVTKEKSLKKELEWKIACIAAQNGNLETTEYITNQASSILRRKDENNYTIDQIAAAYGHPKIIGHVLNKKRRSSYKIERIQSLLQIAAQKGHMNVIQYLEKSFKYEIFGSQEKIGEHAVNNGHIYLACYLAKLEPLYCNNFKGVIRKVLQKNKVLKDNKTMELVAELAAEWENNWYCPNIIELAYKQNDTELLKWIAEKKCYLFSKKGPAYQPYVSSEQFTPMKVAFEQNLLNQKFLECLKANNVLENEMGYIKNTICHFAAEYNRLDVIQFVANEDEALLERQNYDQRTAVDIAAEKGYTNIVRYVVCKKPLCIVRQYNFWYRSCTTAVDLAMNNDFMDMETLKCVVEKKRFPLTQICDPGHKETVAHTAARKGKTELLRYIVEKEPSVLEISDYERNTVLHILAKNAYLSMEDLKFFVSKGAPLNSQNCLENTPVHIFAIGGYVDFVEYLVEKEPSVLTLKNNEGDTILHILSKKNILSLKSMRFMIDKGAPFMIKNRGGDSIALIETRHGNLPFLEYILQKEPSLWTENASALTEIIKMAAEHGHSDILKFIVEKEPNFLAERINILFELSVQSKVLDVLKYLKAMCEKHKQSWGRRHESEVLREAMKYDYPDVLKYMNYNVNMLYEEKEPLILTAVRCKRSNIFNYLAKEDKVNLTALDNEGNNFLFVAAKARDLDKLQYILDTLKVPINIEWRNNAGDTLLHVAVHEVLAQSDRVEEERREYQSTVEYSYHYNSSYKPYNIYKGYKSGEFYDEEYGKSINILEYLVEQKKVDVNARGQGNKTVLHCATSCHNYQISDYLINHGANPKLRDTEGKNFWDFVHYPTLATTSTDTYW